MCTCRLSADLYLVIDYLDARFELTSTLDTALDTTLDRTLDTWGVLLDGNFAILSS